MRLEELERELRAERPAPDLDFARRLDEWAEAGFPRDRGLGPGTAARRGALRRLWDRASSIPPRSVLVPAGAVATLVVVVGVAITGTETGSDDPPDTSLSRPATSAESAAGDAAQAPARGAEALELDSGALKPVVPSAADSAAGIARGTEDRIVDASARITLGAEAGEVQEVANGVVEVTDTYDGIVSSSRVTRDQGGARASFELEIPYKHLNAALSDLSGLADVISRTEGGEDITARAVRARKDLARTLDQVREARIDLIGADTHEQRLVIKARIATLEATADAQRAQLRGVERQGRFATVGVDVTSDGPGSDGDGDWSLGDALDDAGRVLEVIGGVALIGLAVLVPLSVVAALAAFAINRSRRHARERALDA